MSLGIRLGGVLAGSLIGALVLSARTGAMGSQGARSTSSLPSGQASLLVKARDAIGTTALWRGVKTMVLKGRRRDRNEASGLEDDFRSSTIEIRIALPDSYVEVRSWSGRTERMGLVGGVAVRRDESDRESRLSPVWVKTFRESLSRLALLCLLRSDTTLPLTLDPAPPQGAGSPRLAFRGAATPSLIVELDPTSFVPTRLHFRVENIVVGSGPTGTHSDIQIIASDRREVAGLRLPHRIEWRRDGLLRAEIVVDSIVLNQPLTPATITR